MTTYPTQATISRPIACDGVALHSGDQVTMTLNPAPEDYGIVFERLDVNANGTVPARYNLVTETTLCTVLENEAGVQVMTVEHIMAALWGLGITNCHITLTGKEIPIMDGSAEPFLFLIECAGIQKQEKPREVLQILQPVAVQENGCSLVIVPKIEGLSMDATIQFSHELIGTQQAAYDFNDITFKHSVSRARTFGFLKDVKMLQANGLAQGGSLENAIVFDEDQILNEDGLRYDDECIRHKILDAVGDFYLCGYHIQGHIMALKPGHRINNVLMRAVMADPANYRIVSADEAFTAPAAAHILPMNAAAQAV